MSLTVLSFVILCVVACHVEGKKGYGETCMFSVDCGGDLRCDWTYTTCSRGFCNCAEDKSRKGGQCSSLLGGTCDVDADCAVTGGHCNTGNRKCECYSSTPTKVTKRFCVGRNETEMRDQCSGKQRYYYIKRGDTKGVATYKKTTSGPCGCPDDLFEKETYCLPRPGNKIDGAECSLTGSRQCKEGLYCTICPGKTDATCRKPFGGQDMSRATVAVIAAGLLLSLTNMM